MKRVKPSILLLDCSSKIENILLKKGYDVESGTVGFINAKRKLPTQLYEKNLFFYNPIRFGDIDKHLISTSTIENQTPEFEIAEISEALARGGILVAFINRITSHLSYLNAAYNWIPGMPLLSSTRDTKIIKDEYFNYFSPIHDIDKITKPVTIALENTSSNFNPLLKNLKDIPLGLCYKFGQGYVFLLPTSNSNDEVILNFINRILPKLWEIDSSTPIIDKFLSPKETTIEEEIKILKENQEKIEKQIEDKTIELTDAKLSKSQLINSDDTAILIIKYMEIALSQKDVALFYIYKIAEAIEKKFGSERVAKEKIGCNAELNLIGKHANASYADIRHAPDPGEKIKEISEEDLTKCFEGGEKMITSYIEYLFRKK